MDHRLRLTTSIRRYRRSYGVTPQAKAALDPGQASDTIPLADRGAAASADDLARGRIVPHGNVSRAIQSGPFPGCRQAGRLSTRIRRRRRSLWLPIWRSPKKSLSIGSTLAPRFASPATSNVASILVTEKLCLRFEKEVVFRGRRALLYAVHRRELAAVLGGVRAARRCNRWRCRHRPCFCSYLRK